MNSNDLLDEGVNILLSAIVREGVIKLENLTLDQCGLASCTWAKYLLDMHYLRTLSIGFNSINDIGLIEFCRNVENCYSITEISVSNNLFGDKAICIGSLLQANAGLLRLDISGNHLSTETIESISYGIQRNNTLINLNMSNCTIFPPDASKLCASLDVNPLVAINLCNNPIDSAIQKNPRRFDLQEGG